jgi:hypothetical protein
MKAFYCQNCGHTVVFENTICISCDRHLGYDPTRDRMVSVEADGGGWRTHDAAPERYRFCKNWEMRGCNWLIALDSKEEFCEACRHNRTIPNISDPASAVAWQKIELAKRRLLYSLIKLGLPHPSAADEDPEPLIFDFLEPEHSRPVFTGHDCGVITISLAEADDAAREKTRQDMGEPYRTLLGHFRHEIGHYYWDRLVRDDNAIQQFRSMFGDERVDYEASLKRHYEAGPPADWQDRYISAYASTHPWEDFAETFAHYLHIVDTLETGRAAGLTLRRADGKAAAVAFDPYRFPKMADMLDHWLDLAFALNNIARAMGQADLYPFVISPTVSEKLGFVQTVIQSKADELASHGESMQPHSVMVVAPRMNAG